MSRLFDLNKPSLEFSFDSPGWRHLVVTRQDSLHRVYLDGDLVLQNTIDSYGGDISLFGAGIVGNALVCRIDNVLFYNRTLTPDEVFTLFLR